MNLNLKLHWENSPAPIGVKGVNKIEVSLPLGAMIIDPTSSVTKDYVDDQDADVKAYADTQDAILQSQLNLKASESYVDAIGTAIIDNVNNSLELKADKTALSDAIIDVYSDVNAKADLTYVDGVKAQQDAAIAQKADTAYVDTQDANITALVGQKADALAVTQALSNKADLVGGKVPASQLPASFDDVLDGTYVNPTTFNDLNSVAYIPESGKLYVDVNTNKTYRWNISAYVEVGGGGIQLGETSSTAYRGDRGKVAYDHAISNGNPHNATTTDIPEGTRLYFTEDRVRLSPLTNLVTTLGLPVIMATDTFIAALGKLQSYSNTIGSTFDSINVVGKNKFNPALAQDGKLLSFSTGAISAYADGVITGLQTVESGKTYTLWIPATSVFNFQTLIYTYANDGTFLGVSRSVPSGSELVNKKPPTGIVWSDSNRTVTFAIPVGSAISKVAFMCNYRTHTFSEFSSLVNSMQLEVGSDKTAFEAYNTDSLKLILKESTLPVIEAFDATAFTVTVDGLYAYVRTAYNNTLDLVQQFRYGQDQVWSNSMVNVVSTKTIPKSTARTATSTAFLTGASLAIQGDDSTPLYYNGTYIGGNHGANFVHRITVVGHGKSFVDVGSRWTSGANTWTIVRILDANILWVISQNTGTASAWNFVTTSLVGVAMTHSSGATNTATITPTADSTVQLTCAVNNHTKTLIADGGRVLNAIGVYNVKSLDIVDSYQIQNLPAAIAWIQGRTGINSDQGMADDSIASDVKVDTTFSFAMNGSYTVNTQATFTSAVNFGFMGFVQAAPINYTGKNILMYVSKVNPVVGGLKTWNFQNVEDITTQIEVVNFAKASWNSTPPDRMTQFVKNGSTKEFGQVIGYNTERASAVPSVRVNTDNAGFVSSIRKMYLKGVTGNIYPSGIIPANTTINNVSYRSFFDLSDKQEFTTNTWYYDNGNYYYVLDIHQTLTNYKLSVPHFMVGKNATLVESSGSFTLHTPLVGEGGLVVSSSGTYGHAVIKLSGNTLSTNDVSEGSNLYFTDARAKTSALSAPLTGLNTSTGGVISASDTVVGALGKLQNQVTNSGASSPTWVNITAVGTVAPHVTPVDIQVARFQGMLWIRGTFNVNTSVATNSELFRITSQVYKPYAYSTSGSARLLQIVSCCNISATVAKQFSVVALGNITNSTQASTVEVVLEAKTALAVGDGTMNIPPTIIGTLAVP